MIIAHIGSWKTGTTAIQYMLRSSKSALKKQEFAFADQNSEFHERNFRPAYRKAIKHIQNGGDVNHSVVHKSVELFHQFSNILGENNVIHSWEPFLGHPFNSSKDCMYHSEATAKWFSLASKHSKISVSISIRNQPDFVEAMYAQEIRKGRCNFGIHRFINEVVPRDLSWDNVVNPFEALGDEINLNVIPYEMMKDNCDKFLDAVFFDSLDHKLFKSIEIKNPSYSHLAVEISRLISPLLSSKELSLFERFLVENFSNKSHPRAEFLTHQMRREIMLSVQENNKRLFERLIRNVDGASYGYF